MILIKIFFFLNAVLASDDVARAHYEFGDHISALVPTIQSVDQEEHKRRFYSSPLLRRWCFRELGLNEYKRLYGSLPESQKDELYSELGLLLMDRWMHNWILVEVLPVMMLPGLIMNSATI